MKDIKFNFKNSLDIKNSDVVLLEENLQHLQNIKIEVVTNENDLFYNEEFGFNLEEFLHREIDEILLLEIEQRIITKLSKREYIVKNSINVSTYSENEKVIAIVRFLIDTESYDFTITLDRVDMEVI